jgi:tetratricopeptide (TPR) repeat protein
MSGSPGNPLVGIGMPVYNGEDFIREALDSLLAQDHRDFELIISDNGSHDATQGICREYQSQDTRIRYIRHPENHGAPWNFEFVAREARGDYFMWAAHDDLWDPSYIRKCLALLEAHPEAVLCCTEDTLIERDGTPSSVWAGYKNIDTLGMTPVRRIHELICRMGWFAIYGLIRREAVLKISLGLDVLGADVILLLELLLLGDFAKVPEHLFKTRIATPGKSYEDYHRDFQVEAKPTTAHFTDSAARLMRTVCNSSLLSSREKMEVFADFIHTLTCENPHWRRLITEELLGADAALSEPQFAWFLGIILAGSVPFDDAKLNPLCEAIYRSPLVKPDLLPMARKILGKAENAGPAPPVDLHQQGVRLFKEGRIEEASHVLGEALRQGETSEGWSDWATLQLARNRLPEAERGFRRALLLDANNGQAAAKLGILLANLGRTHEAVLPLELSIPRIPRVDRAGVVELLNECRAKLAVPAI